MDKTGIIWFFVHMLEVVHYKISQKVSEVFDIYTKLHDIRISLFNPDGSLIYPDAVNRPNCTHCRMLRETLGLESKCLDLDREMMNVAFRRGGMISYTCHAGMREVAAPIFVNQELVAYVILGQFRDDFSPVESPYSERWVKEQGNGDLAEAYGRTAFFPENKIELLLSMFQHLLEFIIGGQLIHHKDYDLIQPVIDRIHGTPEEELALDEAADLIGRSASTVTRLFKKMVGQGFKQYQVGYRLELAARNLVAMPNRPVADVSAGVGYEDPLYFSRVFRKKYGVSPTEFRRESRRNK